MSITTGTIFARRGMRVTMLIAAAGLSGSGLLLAGCASGSSSSAGSSESGAGTAVAEPAAAPSAENGAGATGSVAHRPQTAGLVTGLAIIRTASLTLRVRSVTATAQQVTTLAAAAGGYVSNEQDSISKVPGQSTVLLQLKVPEAAYPALLGKLSSTFGRPVSATQNAQDVTGQVADVNSRVASAQDAITQLRALLKKAGTVGGLLSVQDEINSQEASLEALQSQQRVLSHETSYATVTMNLLSQHHKAVVHHKGKHHGFVAGLASGWHGLKAATSWLLTVAGAILPFLAVVAVLGAGGWLVLRRYRARRRTQPVAADS